LFQTSTCHVCHCGIPDVPDARAIAGTNGGEIGGAGLGAGGIGGAGGGEGRGGGRGGEGATEAEGEGDAEGEGATEGVGDGESGGDAEGVGVMEGRGRTVADGRGEGIGISAGGAIGSTTIGSELAAGCGGPDPDGDPRPAERLIANNSPKGRGNFTL
jgi:hypothetical protein